MNRKIDKSIDLTMLPINRYGIDWINTIGYIIPFEYNKIIGELQIISYKDYMVCVCYKDILYNIKCNQLKNCSLGVIFGNSTTKFKYNTGDKIIDDTRNIEILNQVRVEQYGMIRKNYKYKCNKCGWDCGVISEAALNSNRGCPCCRGLTVVEGINDIPTTASWMVQYFQGGYEEAKLYTHSSSKIIYPICPICRKIKPNPLKIASIFINHSIGCTCGDGISYPNKFMYNILHQLNIDFISEYSPDWIKPKRYDFYFEIDDRKYIIEMDGGLGHGNKNFDKTIPIETAVLVDKLKDSLAIKNNIQIIRIDAKKSDLNYIKNNILSSNLINILSLRNINWTLCHDYALSSLVKQICEYKSEHTNISSSQLAKIFNLRVGTVIGYMKKGTECGLCNYDPVLENKNKRNTIPIKCNENNYVFSSTSECYKNSNNIFGIQLDIGSIYFVLNGKYKQHKGFTFNYITHEEFNTIKQQSPELAFGDFFILERNDQTA